MTILRVQVRQMLSRLRGVCPSADAAVAGTPCIAARSCTTLAAADGYSFSGADAVSARRMQHSCDSRSSFQQPTSHGPASHAPADSLLWTFYGIHSLRPAIAAVLLQPSATGTLAPVPIQQQREQLHDADFLDDAVGVSGISEDQPAGAVMELVKRTYQPSVIVRKRRHGFLSRLRSKGGQRVLERRRLKGRWKKSA